MNILDIAIAKQLAGGGGGSGTDNYNDLSNLPKINDTTLSGNKSSSALGLQSEINSDSKLASDLVDDTNQDNKFVTSTEKNTWNAKQNAIDADHKLSSSLVSFTDAEAAALASGIDSSKVGQISTNQTNILYTLGKTGKNIFDFDAWIDGLTTTRGTFTISGNSITITATDNDCSTDRWNPSSSVSPVFKIPTKAGEVIILQWNADLSQASNGGTVYIFPNGSPASPVWTYASSTKITFTVPSGCEFITFRFGVARSGETITFSNIMICTQEDWNISPDYQPYRGLPNYDLTVREAEDRAALAEQVDEGTKNLMQNMATSTTIKGVTFTVNSDGSVSTYGTTDSTDCIFYLNPNFTFKSGVTYVVSGCPSGGSTAGYRLCNMGASYVDEYGDGAVCVGDGVTRSFAIYIASAGTNLGTVQSPKIWKPMICTETDWKISQKYVPFALPNSDLTDREATDRTELARLIDSGAKNLFDFNACFDPSGVTISSDGTFTTQGDTRTTLTFEINRRNGSTTVGYILTPTQLTANGVYYWTFTKDSTFDRLIFGHNGGTTNGRCLIMVDKLVNGVEYVFRMDVTQCTDSSGVFKWKNVMICTKAAFDISPAFVPYRPDYDTLVNGGAAPFFTIPINHNMIYRGKNLGDTLTDAQHTALSSGNFTDLYLGDYWTKQITIPAFYELTTAEPSDWSTNYTSYYTKSGDTYTPVTGDTAPTWAADTYYERLVPSQTVTLKAIIADFDTFYAGYASGYAAINTHHAAVIVTGFSNVVWNSTNTTAGGYVNSLIHKWLVGSVLPEIETWFGSTKVLSHQKLLTNAITGDAASGWAWSSQKISLLSENQMYGSKVWGNSKAANGGYEPGEAHKHLNVFNHIDANLLFGNKNIWLRDIASAGWAARLNYDGHAGNNGASHTWVAPAALILLS